MKIGYRLLDSPFKYHLSYLNDNLYYIPPNHATISLFGTLINQTSKTPPDIKLPIPVDNGEKGGFDFTLKVANVFDQCCHQQYQCQLHTRPVNSYLA